MERLDSLLWDNIKSEHKAERNGYSKTQKPQNKASFNRSAVPHQSLLFPTLPPRIPSLKPLSGGECGHPHTDITLAFRSPGPDARSPLHAPFSASCVNAGSRGSSVRSLLSEPFLLTTPCIAQFPPPAEGLRGSGSLPEAPDGRFLNTLHHSNRTTPQEFNVLVRGLTLHSGNPRRTPEAPPLIAELTDSTSPTALEGPSTQAPTTVRQARVTRLHNCGCLPLSHLASHHPHCPTLISPKPVCPQSLYCLKSLTGSPTCLDMPESDPQNLYDLGPDRLSPAFSPTLTPATLSNL